MFKKKYLFLLPFDHRNFFAEYFKFGKVLTTSQKKKIEELKRVIYDGFLLASKSSKFKNYMGILIDERYGSSIIKSAKTKKIILSVSVEKSGKEFFEFEYGNKFKDHILKVKPTLAKILIKYDCRKSNASQLKKMKIFSDFCCSQKIDFVLELLTPKCSDKVILTKCAVSEILKFGIYPSIWKIEGYEKKSDWKNVINEISNLQKNPKIIMLGRGESDVLVEKWIKASMGIKEIIGFAIGRTIFLKSISDFYQNKISRECAVKNISDKYIYFINLWTK